MNWLDLMLRAVTVTAALAALHWLSPFP